MFDVASTEDSQFLNLVIELDDNTVPFFRARRRGTIDTGPTALDFPTSFTADRISARGYDTGAIFDGFTGADGTYTVAIDNLQPTDSLFMSATDSRLVTSPPSPALNTGVDPEATLGLPFEAGVSLNGVDRKPVAPTIDRGAYEQ